MKALQLAYHYTKSHVFNSCSSAVKLASLTKKDKDINFAIAILKVKNESIQKLRKNDFNLYNSKLNKNHKLFSQLTSLSLKDSPLFKRQNTDSVKDSTLFKSQNSNLENSLRKALSDFQENPGEAIKKHLNGHININPHSKIGTECIAYFGNRK
ncbi:hypothetical protein ACWWJF_04230 [Symbiopectobacterium sp. Eva_TO]